eukprot:9216165-Alexandrium_andersonii.AAC.1
MSATACQCRSSPPARSPSVSTPALSAGAPCCLLQGSSPTLHGDRDWDSGDAPLEASPVAGLPLPAGPLRGGGP